MDFDEFNDDEVVDEGQDPEVVAPPEPRTLTLTDDDLPEDMRGMEPKALAQTVKMMRQIIQERGTPAPTPAAAPAPEPKKELAKPLEELIYEDPKAAVSHIVEELLGGKVKQFEDFAGNTTLQLARNQLPDFQEYEDRVTSILNSSGVPATAENIRGAYLMARGEADLGRKTATKAKADNPVRSSNGTQGDPSKVKGQRPTLTDLDKQLMVAGGFKDTAEYIKYRDSNGPYEVNVPTGA